MNNDIIEVLSKMSSNTIKGIERISFFEIRIILDDDSSIHFRFRRRASSDLGIFYSPSQIIEWSEVNK